MEIKLFATPRSVSTMHQLLLILSVTFGGVTSHLNFYMNETETTRLLGVPGELYYCRNGDVNSYALSFNLPIKTNITDVYFDWVNEPPLGLQEPDLPMTYTMSLTVSNQHAMYLPLASIPLSGTVPTKVTGFSVSLLCTGLLSTDVDVKIQLNVTRAADVIVMEVRRKKPCLRGAAQLRPASRPKIDIQKEIHTTLMLKSSTPVPTPAQLVSASLPETERDGTFNLDAVRIDDEDQPEEEQKALLSEDAAASRSTAVVGPASTHYSVYYAASGCALFVLVIVVVVVGVVCWRASRVGAEKKSRPGNLMRRDASVFSNSTSSKVPHGESSFLVNDDSKEHVTQTGSCNLISSGKLSQSSSDEDVEEIRSVLAALRIEPCRLTINEMLLQGTYSCICQASWLAGGESNVLSEERVFVKSIKDHARPADEEFSRMMKDCVSLVGLHHENLSPVVAVCMDAQLCRPLRLVYVAAPDGNLKLFLQRCRHNQLLSLEQLTCLAIQLAAAVQYLHRQRVLHRDIATRNCTFDASCMSVRLSDGAMSPDIFPHDYHCLEAGGGGAVVGQDAVPVKWMALESLPVSAKSGERIYTTATDVWSFGVMIWELLTFGLEPYYDIEPSDMLLYLRHGHRLTPPYGCPAELYTAMSRCWLDDPSERPTVVQLQTFLHNFCSSLARIK